MVGQLGDPVPIGAVAIGAVILSALYWLFGFLRMGTTGLTSQALGAEDQGEADALLSRALIIGVGGGVLIVALQWALFPLAFLVSPASPEVETMARTYMSIRIWSAPAAIALFGPAFGIPGIDVLGGAYVTSGAIAVLLAVVGVLFVREAD